MSARRKPTHPRVLGGRGGPVEGVSLTGEQRTNTGSPEAATVGWGADRVGKKFSVGFDRAGRIVHLYGNDVAAPERVQVLNKHMPAPAPQERPQVVSQQRQPTTSSPTPPTPQQLVDSATPTRWEHGGEPKVVVKGGYVRHIYPDGYAVAVRKAPKR